MNYFHNLSFRQQFTVLAFLSATPYLIFSLLENIFVTILLFSITPFIYGLLTIISMKKHIPRVKKITWIFFSILSYIVAGLIAIAIGDDGYFFPDPNILSISLAGLFGALILSIGFKIIIGQENKIIPIFNIIIISLVGGVIPYIIFSITEPNYYLIYCLIYTIWPTVISFMLASSIRKID